MATKHFTGNASAVAQVDDGSIDSVDATPSNNDFTITVGSGSNTASVTVAGDTDAATTAAALVQAANNSSHPYFTGITFTNPSSGNIKATADDAGEPFTASLTVSGGGSGGVTDFSNTTASAGPNHLDSADNWSDGSVPTGTDDIVFQDGSTNVLWGLDQVSAASVTWKRTYTGKLGLRSDAFATNADGSSVDTSAQEYRQGYLKVGASNYDINEYFGPETPSGANRIKVDADTAAATVRVHAAPLRASESNAAPVRLLANSASTDIVILGASQGVGIATDAPGETATVNRIDIEPSRQAQLEVGAGVTISTAYSQRAGTVTLRAAADIPAVDAFGGSLLILGAIKVTTINVDGANVRPGNSPASGDAIGTLNLEGGTVDMLARRESRSIGALDVNGGSLVYDPDIVTIPVPSGDKPLAIQRA